MRKILFLVVLSICLINKLSSQISTENLLAYYPFDGDVLDKGPNEFHGVLIGGDFVEDSNGNLNSALKFNGSSDYINLSVFAEILKDNIDEVTIYFKVKFDSDKEFQSILSLGNDGETINNNVFEIEFENDQFQVETETGTNALNHELQIDQTQFVVDQQWHQILIKINKDSLTYCRDNMLIYKDTYVPMETTTDELFIGCFDGNNPINPCCYFDGVLDELQIYGSVDLQAEETISFIGCENDDFSITINETLYNSNNPNGVELIESDCCIDTLYTIDLSFVDDLFIEINEQHCEGSDFSLTVGNEVYDISNPVGVEVLQSANGCDSIVTINLEFVPASIDSVTYLGCMGDGFEVSVNGSLYNESNPQGQEVLSNQIGCDSIIVIDLVYSEFSSDVRLPNIFTPGSSGNNIFRIGDGNKLQILNLQIFDRWGNLVYDNDNTEQEWDGNINGSPAPSDVYIYTVTYQFPGQESIQKSSDLTLLR